MHALFKLENNQCQEGPPPHTNPISFRYNFERGNHRREKSENEDDDCCMFLTQAPGTLLHSFYHPNSEKEKKLC